MWATHVQHKDAKLRLGVLALEPQLLPGGLDVLLQLLDGVLEGGAGVVDLIDDEDLLSYEVLHLAEAGQVEPLGAGDLLAGLLDDAVGAAEGLVERQADGLDGDVGAARLLEEGPQDARGHVAPAADGDHEMGLEVVEDVGGGLLAELVDLEGGGRQESETRIFGGRVCGCARAGAHGERRHWRWGVWVVRLGGMRLGRLGSRRYTHIIVGDVELLDHAGRWVAAGSEPWSSRVYADVSAACKCNGSTCGE